MRRTVLVLVLVTILVAAMATPAFAVKIRPGGLGNCGTKGVDEPFFGSDFLTSGYGGGFKLHYCQNS